MVVMFTDIHPIMETVGKIESSRLYAGLARIAPNVDIANGPARLYRNVFATSITCSGLARTQ